VFFVASEGGVDDREGCGGGEQVFDFDFFAFEGFVVEEESAEKGTAVGRKLRDFIDIRDLGVIEADREDFVIGFAAVDHDHETNGLSANDGEGDDAFFAEYEDIEGVAIFGEGAGYEAVVCGVVDGGVEHAIKSEESSGFVELVFDSGAAGNLNDGKELVGNTWSRFDVMPGVDHSEDLSVEIVKSSLPVS
jgi:hypothetical protein